MRVVEFRGGRFLARLFLVVEPIIGLSRAQRLMAWLVTHPPFHLRDAHRREAEAEARWIDEGDDGLPPADPRLLGL